MNRLLVLLAIFCAVLTLALFALPNEPSNIKMDIFEDVGKLKVNIGGAVSEIDTSNILYTEDIKDGDKLIAYISDKVVQKDSVKAMIDGKEQTIQEDESKRTDRERFYKVKENRWIKKIYSGSNYWEKDGVFYEVSIATTTKAEYDKLETVKEVLKGISGEEMIGVATSTNPSSDNGMYNGDAAFSTARNATAADSLRSGEGYIAAKKAGAIYYIDRYFANILVNIGASSTINSASYSIYVTTDSARSSTRKTNIYNSSAETTITTADYDQAGTTEYANGINCAFATTSAFNVYNFNATGIAAIPVVGTFKLSARESNKDVANSTPTDNYDIYITTNTNADANKRPYLTIDYTEVGGEAVDTPTRPEIIIFN